MIAVPKRKGIDCFAKQKRSGPKTIAGFTEMWACDQKRDAAFVGFAGDWLPNAVDGKRVGYTKVPASEIVASYANGVHVKVDSAVLQAGQHIVKQLYAFADSREAASGDPINDIVLVAQVCHSLCKGPWEKKPLEWWSVDEAKVIRQEGDSFQILDVKSSTWETGVAANKNFDDSSEGYATLDNVTPMYRTPNTHTSTSGD